MYEKLKRDRSEKEAETMEGERESERPLLLTIPSSCTHIVKLLFIIILLFVIITQKILQSKSNLSVSAGERMHNHQLTFFKNVGIEPRDIEGVRQMV